MSTPATVSMLSETFYAGVTGDENVTSVSSSGCASSSPPPPTTSGGDLDKSLCSSASPSGGEYYFSPNSSCYHLESLSTSTAALMPSETTILASSLVMSPTPPATSGSSNSSSPSQATMHVYDHHDHLHSLQQQQQSTMMSNVFQQPLEAHFSMSEFIKTEPIANIEFSGLYGSFEDFSFETLHPSSVACGTNWTHKCPEQWTPAETLDWVRSWAHHNGVEEMELSHFLYTPLSGPDLCVIGRDYFVSVCPHYGHQLYDTFQSLLAQYNRSTLDSNSQGAAYYADMAPTAPPMVVHHGLTFLEEEDDYHHHHHYHHQLMNIVDGTMVFNAQADGEPHHSPMATHMQSPPKSSSPSSVVLPSSDFFAQVGGSFLSSSSSSSQVQPQQVFDVQHIQPQQVASMSYNNSPCYSVCESDRESTSSNLSGMNEKGHGLASMLSCTSSSSYPIMTHVHSVSMNHNFQPSLMMPPLKHAEPSSSLSPSTSHELVDQLANGVTTTSDDTPTLQVNSAATNTKRASDGRRRGRPPKKEAKSRNKGNGKLWEFIRDLLLNPVTNPSLIRWERREDGIFKFIQSDKVAKMWGERKQNPRMTYEKLSRAMRYYYKSQVLLPVFGRRLVYKFGPNATGWRPQFDMPRPIGM